MNMYRHPERAVVVVPILVPLLMNCTDINELAEETES
jgi:hypothetical protein